MCLLLEQVSAYAAGLYVSQGYLRTRNLAKKLGKVLEGCFVHGQEKAPPTSYSSSARYYYAL